MAIKVYFPEVLGSDAIAYIDGRLKKHESIQDRIRAHVKNNARFMQGVTHAVYSRREDMRLDLLERLGRVVYIHDTTPYTINNGRLHE